MGAAEAARVHFTQEELRNFARVYPRLYDVPTVSRGRLEGWRDSHPQAVRDWAS